MKIEASRSIKWLYCLTLIAGIFPSGIFGASGWVGLATGGGMLGAGMIPLVILLAAFIYRIVVVSRQPHTLDAHVPNARIKLLRRFGIFLMSAGLIGSLAIFFIRPLALGIFGKPGDAGVAFFVVGLFVYLISSAGLLGLIVFEASRLFGFEHQHKNEHTGAPITVPVTPPITPNLNIKHPRSAA